MPSILTEQQIGVLKKQLNERLAQVREEIHQELLKADNEQYSELAGRVHDPEEESVADLLVDVNLAVIDRHVQEVRDIDAALLRMVAGTYGVCIDCENPIGFERLQAYSTAKRCRQCQTLYEKTKEKYSSL
jgi:RNA polymerase-binding protein DksA